MNLREREAYTRQLYAIGRCHACQLRLSVDDAEDCTMEFVGRMLRMEGLHRQEKKFHASAWLHRCARRHCLNWLRSLRRYHALVAPHFALMPEQESGDLIDTTPTPEELFLSRVFWKQLAVTMQQLAEVPGSLFVGFYIKGYTTQELARSFGMTSNAVEQSLLRSRRRLRVLLEQKGWNEETVMECLTTLGSHVRPSFPE